MDYGLTPILCHRGSSDRKETKAENNYTQLTFSDYLQELLHYCLLKNCRVNQSILWDSMFQSEHKVIEAKCTFGEN
jgi:hypothetical protein